MRHKRRRTFIPNPRAAIVPALVTLTCLVGAYFLRHLITTGLRGLLTVVVPVLVLAWVFLARSNWWALLPVGLSFGGFIHHGFRIYTHELALLLSTLALVPVLLVQKLQRQKRPPLSAAAYVLPAYLLLHMAFSIGMTYFHGIGGRGTIFRVYVGALWPLAFLHLFHRYGSTRKAKGVLLAMYVAALIRVSFAGATHLGARLLFIPFLNFLSPAFQSGAADARAVAVPLLAFSLCLYCIQRGAPALRWFHFLVAAAMPITVLTGGGRGSLAALILIGAFWTIATRRILLLAAVFTIVLASAITINVNPRLVDPLPPAMRRTLSAFLVRGHNSDLRAMAASSDLWHGDLRKRGFRRWTKSPAHFLLGNAVEPYSQPTQTENFFVAAQVAAARLGSYESGFYAIMAVLGCVGAVLYGWLFASMLRQTILGRLRRRGIDDTTGAFCFLAVAFSASWVLLSLYSGHFPSWELLLCVIASTACIDEQREDDRVGTTPAAAAPAHEDTP